MSRNRIESTWREEPHADGHCPSTGGLEAVGAVAAAESE
jgi:hypothetical protein